MTECPVCSLKKGERVVSSPLSPVPAAMVTERTEQGFIEIQFVYGDEVVMRYHPVFCPECGQRLTKE